MHTTATSTAPIQQDETSVRADLTESPSLLRLADAPYFPIAFIARLPFAMIVIGVLTVVVAARESMALGGLVSAFVGLGAATVGPLLGAGADRFGQRPVLLIIAPVNSVLLVVFAVVVYGEAATPLLLLTAFGIGATAPQVAPLSRSRLVTLITDRMQASKKPRTLAATMSYESAADEMVFVFGPFLVGLLASMLAPWAPLVIAATLSMIFVVAFAMHPTGALRSRERSGTGAASSRAVELCRPQLLVVVFGIIGVGMFFGSVLTSLTSFMSDMGEPESAGLYYGVMGIGSAVLALGAAWLPTRFTLAGRWLSFGAILLAGSLLLAFADSLSGMILALVLMGTGVGPVLVTMFSLGAERSPLGRSATVMTMLGSGIIVGQSAAAAVTGQVAEAVGTGAAMWAAACAALVVMLAGVVNAMLPRA